MSLLLVLILVAAACSGSDSTAATDSAVSGERPAEGTAPPGDPTTLDWGACADDAAAMAGLDCATLAVPVDHDDPDGAMLDLAVARVPATGDPDQRIGSLVVNPGGPGGSGVEFLANAAALFPEELARRFDLVSFDPRGVAGSDPVRCLDDETMDEQLEADLSPEEPAEVDELIEDQRELLAACRERSPELLEHMSTADVAADLDLLRAALGDEGLTYLGLSYGTSIGAVYATMFPDSTRALVLDGAVSPDAGAEEQALAQATGFERTLDAFLADCDADPSCPLAPDASARLEQARSRLADGPITVDTGTGERLLTDDLFTLAVAAALYDTATWETLATAIDEIDGPGAATLLSLADRLTGRQPDGTYDNSSAAQTMVNCADTTERPDVERAAAAARRIGGAAPTFGPVLGWGVLGCLGWPLADDPPPPVTGQGAPPLLVIGTVGDPATPYEWAGELAGALESARLLTYEGDGHTAFLTGGACVSDAVVDYLVELVLPPEGARCPAQEDAGLGSIRDQVLDQFAAAGIPDDVAECVVDGIVAEVGEAEFERLVLSQDSAELTRLVTAQTLRCATGG